MSRFDPEITGSKGSSEADWHGP